MRDPRRTAASALNVVHSGLDQTLLGAAAVTLVGGMLGMGFRYALTFILARGYTAAVVGSFAFGVVVLQIGGLLSRVGLDSAAQRYVSIYESNGDWARVSGTVAVCLVVPLVIGSVVAVAGLIAFETFGRGLDPRISSVTWLFVLGIPLYGMMWTAMAATRGFKRAKYMTYVRDVIQSGTAVLVAGLGAVSGLSVAWVVGGYLLSVGFGTALALWFLHKEGAFRAIRTAVFEVRELLSYALPLFAAALSSYVTRWTDLLMLGVLVPAAAVGRYHVAFQAAWLLSIGLRSVNSVFPAMAADLHEQQQFEELGQRFEAVTRWVSMLTLLGLLYLIVYGEAILELFGETYGSALLPLAVLAGAQFVAVSTGPSGYLLSMSEYERVEAANTVGVAVLNVGLNFVLITEHGIIGAAIATGTSVALLNIARLFEVRALIGIQPYSRRYLKGLLGVAVGGVVLAAGTRLSDPGVLWLVAVGTLAVAAFVSTMWTLGVEERDRVLIDSIA